MISNIAFREDNEKAIRVIEEVLGNYQAKDLFPIEIEGSKFIGIISIENKDMGIIESKAKSNGCKPSIVVGNINGTSIKIDVLLLQS